MRLNLRIAGALIAVLGMLAPVPDAAAGKFLNKKEEGAKYTPGDKWEAYIHDDKGLDWALRQPVEQNDEKDWMFLRFTDYKGPKNRLAIMQIENKTASVEQAENGEDGTVVVTSHIAEVPVAALEEMLTTSLFNTNRFELTERKAIQTVLAEQDFGKSGRVSEQTAAKVGKLLGANYMMFAAVNEWTPVKSRIGGAIGGYGAKILGAVGGGKTTAEIAMSFRIVDATSGKVLFSETVRAEAGSWGLIIGGFGGPGGGMGGLDRSSPIGYAVQSCLNKAAYKIAMFLKERSWTGTVAKVEGGKVYVNAGSDSGLVTGTKLIALSKGEAIIDPTTGLSLGDDTDVIGHLQVTTVKEKYSIAAIVEGCEGLKKGDLVELAEGGLTGTPLSSGGGGNP